MTASANPLASARAAKASTIWPSRLLLLTGSAAVMGGGIGALGLPLGALAVPGVAVALVVLRLLLPSWAHAAFAAGALASARRRYRAISATSWRRGRRLHAELSLAAVALAQGRYAHAEEVLDALAGAAMDLSTRAAWLNNRAYAWLRRGERVAEARALAAEALALRPDVPGVRHTHGLALLACGELDAAIAELDELHRMGELPALLEAERCADLAEAWAQKGEDAYAAEYRGRAELSRRRARG
ncbi:MAG: hypothetical protein R3B48_08955 [Kofleriaceae bacterium]